MRQNSVRLGIALVWLCLISGIQVWAQPQATQGFSYQAVTRDNTGALLQNQPVNLRFQVRQGSPGGSIVYQETHAPVSNGFGLINTVIGGGTVEIGQFNTLDWRSQALYLVVEINGASADTVAFQSVPYAKIATDMQLGDLEDVDAPTPTTGQALVWDGTQWAPATVSSGTTYTAGTGIDITGAVISNTGDTNASDDITIGSTAGGDLAGTYPNPDVARLQGRPVAGGAPTTGQALVWNGTQWAPATISSGGTYTSGAGISIVGTTIINTGDINAADDITTASSANGDITGGFSNLQIVANAVGAAEIASNAVGSDEIAANAVGTSEIANAAVTAAKLNQSGATNGQVLKWNGTAWAPAADDNTTYSAGSGLTLSGTTFAALDPSPTNEIQVLSLSSSTLSLSNGGGSVVLPSGTPSQWTTNGTAIHYNTGNVGIGDATPANTLTVGNGDKFQVSGIDGDVIFTDPQGTIRFPTVPAAGAAPMIQMFSGGTQNADRMVIAHSSSSSTWGLEYKDTTDVMFLRSSSGRKFAFELSSGHMGIGVENPAFPLEISGHMRLRSTGNLSNSPGIWFQNNAGTFDRAFIGMSEPDSVIGIFSQHMNKWAVEFEVMREPRIGINVPAGSPPRAELHLYHTNFGGSNDGVRIQNEGSNSHYWNLYTSNTTGGFEFFKQGIKRATINQTSGAYTAVSDARLKTNIGLLGSVMPQVMRLQPKTYQYTDMGDERYFTGLLAQELQAEFPQFVYFGGDDQKYYTVDYAGLSVIALKAIQEQQQVIETQQTQISELEEAVRRLQAQMQALLDAASQND